MDWAHLLNIVGRTLVIYIAVLGGLRLGGRREVAQLEPFDLVVILLVSNAVQNSMVGADVSLEGGVVSAATLLAANYTVSALSARSCTFRRIVEGKARVLIDNGHIVEASLRKEHLVPQDIQRIIESRLDTPTSIEDVQRAVLEVDGSVSIIRKDKSIDRSSNRLPSRRFRRRYRPTP